MRVYSNEQQAKLALVIFNNRHNRNRVKKFEKYALAKKHGEFIIYDLKNKSEVAYVGDN